MKKILLRLLMALGVFILVVVANYFIFSLIATRITEGVPITKNRFRPYGLAGSRYPGRDHR